MMSATSLGCDAIDAWLAATVRTVAFIRLAMNCCAGGGIIWSSSETRYHDGSGFHAGNPDFPVNDLRLDGFCATAMTAAQAGSTSAANAAANPSPSIQRYP
jgi:hypothetical protein